MLETLTRRRQWHPTPVLLPGKSHGRSSLVGCGPMGSLRVRQDWASSLSLFTCMHWRRKWQPIPVFLPGESQEWGSLVGSHLWGHTEWDTTEATWQQQQQHRCICTLHLLTSSQQPSKITNLIHLVFQIVIQFLFSHLVSGRNEREVHDQIKWKDKSSFF